MKAARIVFRGDLLRSLDSLLWFSGSAASASKRRTMRAILIHLGQKSDNLLFFRKLQDLQMVQIVLTPMLLALLVGIPV